MFNISFILKERLKASVLFKVVGYVTQQLLVGTFILQLLYFF